MTDEPEMTVSEALRLAAECAYLSPMEQIMQHMGQCEVHNILYVEINPAKPKGCPICAGYVKDNGDGTMNIDVKGLSE